MCSTSIYNDIVPFDKSIHPRNTRQYPYEKVSDTETFIRRAQWVHGVGKFDYSETVFVKSNKDVIIRCSVCGGEFQQRPNNHLNAKHCPICIGRRLSTESVVKQFKAVHGERYGYEKVVYNGDDSRVSIFCKQCGVYFQQTPHLHKAGNGHNRCKGSRITKSKLLDREEFIKRSKSVHGDKYDYSLVEYVRARKKVKIICSEHGVFEQAASSHMLGSGCNECGLKKFYDSARGGFVPEAIRDSEYNNPMFLYLVEFINKETGKTFYKIGITKNEPRFRFRAYTKKFHIRIIRAEQFPAIIASIREDSFMSNLQSLKLSHRVHDLKGHRGGGWTECFSDKHFDELSPESYFDEDFVFHERYTKYLNKLHGILAEET